MRAMADGPKLSRHFFIVMDRLYETLQEKIAEWSQLEKSVGGGGSGSGKILLAGLGLMGGKAKVKNKSKPELEQLLCERLVFAYDIATAFAYMHENQIVYRDVKQVRSNKPDPTLFVEDCACWPVSRSLTFNPQDNIGFDIRGDVKIFDFGLAKGLSPSLKNNDGYGYNLTARTGSVPYMAPEVCTGKEALADGMPSDGKPSHAFRHVSYFHDWLRHRS